MAVLSAEVRQRCDHASVVKETKVLSRFSAYAAGRCRRVRPDRFTASTPTATQVDVMQPRIA